jgi:hypothetical protein
LLHNSALVVQLSLTALLTTSVTVVVTCMAPVNSPDSFVAGQDQFPDSTPVAALYFPENT